MMEVVYFYVSATTKKGWYRLILAFAPNAEFREGITQILPMADWTGELVNYPGATVCSAKRLKPLQIQKVIAKVNGLAGLNLSWREGSASLVQK